MHNNELTQVEGVLYLQGNLNWSLSVIVKCSHSSRVSIVFLYLCAEEASAIMKAMSGFNLPATVTPDWAKVIPEDVWKAELLAGLRNNSKHH